MAYAFHSFFFSFAHIKALPPILLLVIVFAIVYITAAPRGFEYIETEEENLTETQLSLCINIHNHSILM